MKYSLFVLVFAGMTTVAAAQDDAVKAPRYDELPANQWVLVHREDASGGKRFARAIWAENVDRLYLWGTGGKNPARNVYERYELESFDPQQPEWQAAFPKASEGKWTAKSFPPFRIYGQSGPDGLKYDEGPRLQVVGGYHSTNRVRWWDFDGIIRPSPVNTFNMACWDSKRSRIIYFSGGFTFALDPKTNSWTDLKPANHPTACRTVAWASMCYDAGNDRVMLFGGGLATNPSGAAPTWFYDCSENVWNRPELDIEPPPRCNAPIVYDSVSRQMVMFAGCDQSAALNDTWVYDCDGNRWERRPSKSSPPPMTALAAAILPGGRVLICGNDARLVRREHLYSTSAVKQTWIYNIKQNVWTPINGDLKLERYSWLTATFVEKLGVVFMVAFGPERRTYALRYDPSGAAIDLAGVPSNTIAWKYPEQKTSLEQAPTPSPEAHAKLLSSLPPNKFVSAEPPGLLISKTWSTAVIDTDRSEVLYVGGGHSGYSGNDIARYNIANNRWSLDFPPRFPPFLESTNAGIFGWSYGMMPFSQHTYLWYCYDPVSKTVVYLARSSLFDGVEVQLGDDPEDDFVWKAKEHGYASWVYDPAAKQMHKPSFGRPFKNHWHLTLTGTPHGVYAVVNEKLYHTKVNRNTGSVEWTLIDATYPRPAKEIKYHYEFQPLLHDTRRDRLIQLKGDASRVDVFARSFDEKSKWQQLATKGNAAIGREAVYIPQHDTILWLGSKLYALDCATNTVSELNVELPKGLYTHECAMVYDAKNDVCVALIPRSFSGPMQTFLFRYNPTSIKKKVNPLKMHTNVARATSLFLVFLFAQSAAAAETLKWIHEPELAFNKDGNNWIVEFELDSLTDVEVAIVDPEKNTVVRHLAAGVLGPKAPPPLAANSRAQKLEWDGMDDYGQPVANAAGCAVRVRAGMGVKLDRIVGGDPYAYWSEFSGQGDHAQWMVTGLEAKPDGSVYVLGNSTFYGGPALRQYDARGGYRRTVFPPPAGKPVEDVKGWGITVRDDGTYTLRSGSSWARATPGKTLMSRGGNALCASLVPTAGRDTLCLASVSGRAFGNQQMTIGSDGTLHQYESATVLGREPLPRNGLSGNFFSALAPDGKSLYVSGLFARDDKKTVQTTGFWRDAQVWKVDVATRKTTVFFALNEKNVIGDMKDRSASPIGHSAPNPYAAFQGVAVDTEGHVFVCDRQNKRIAVLDNEGKLIRVIPVAYPDAVAVNPKSKAIYVTTRFGNYSGKGELNLLKFSDWMKDDAPAATVPLRGGIGKFRENSLVAVAEDKGEILVWVAYTTLPVRVYRDTGAALELVKDFYEAGPQRALDLQHMQVDQKTGDVYIADAHGFCFRLTDWKNPKFVPCMQDARTPLRASSIAIDTRSRHLYTHYHWGTPVYRWSMAGEFFTPAPAGVLETDRVVSLSGRPVPAGGFDHATTPPITCSWIFTGLGERGMAVGPGGGLATLGVLPDKDNRADDYSGPLHYFKPDWDRTPWKPLRFKNFGGKKPRSGGIRFDPRGNLYVGVYDGKVNNVPQGFDKAPDFTATTGRIYKYVPTGSVAGGDLFPKEPAAPAKVYDIHYGPLARQSRTPRFGVDSYGRLYYPTGLQPRVSVIDNEGNLILSFGTYGNRDSMGGLPGDLVPTKDIPMAWPNSVDATDDYIYVSDIVNVRLLRLKKTFDAVATSQ